MKLRENADTTHQDPEYWYAAYGAHISTESAGDVCIQEVDPQWLTDCPDDLPLIAKWGAAMRAKMTGEECEQLVALARAAWDAATDLHYYRERAVDAYLEGDLEGVVDWLRIAAREERKYGDDPAASALRAQLLEEETA